MLCHRKKKQVNFWFLIRGILLKNSQEFARSSALLHATESCTGSIRSPISQFKKLLAPVSVSLFKISSIVFLCYFFPVSWVCLFGVCAFCLVVASLACKCCCSLFLLLFIPLIAVYFVARRASSSSSSVSVVLPLNLITDWFIRLWYMWNIVQINEK